MFRYSFNELRLRNCDFPDIFLPSYPQCNTYFIYDLSDNKNVEDENRNEKFK